MASTKHTSTGDWKARELAAPDGRTYTPTSAREENELVVGGGYTFTKPGEPVSLADADSPAPGAAEPAMDDKKGARAK